MTVRFLDPGAGPPHSATRYDLLLDEDCKDPQIGLVANGFADSVAFLNEVEHSLSEYMPQATFVRYTKPRLGTPFEEEEAVSLFGTCDAMVLALGHCGSCTAATTRDTATFARCGLPVVALVTEVFQTLADEVGYSVGMTELPVVVLPHPTAGTGHERLKEIAATAAPEILRHLRGTSS